jgi:predicted nuclease with TOPRIM domain
VIGRVALKKRIKVLEEVIAGKTRVAKEMFKLKVETEQYDDVIAGLKLEISNLKDNNAKLELRLSFCKKQIADLVKKISS